jgi:hypothetical protein
MGYEYTTLLYGEHDAVVVDTFATIDQNQQLVDWITKSGTKPQVALAWMQLLLSACIL